MKRLVLGFVVLFGFVSSPQLAKSQAQQLQRWEQRARNVTITRDDWGIAHVHGKTDAGHKLSGSRRIFGLRQDGIP